MWDRTAEQRILIRVWRHLRRQGCKSLQKSAYGTEDSCWYRGPNGLRCAIGCLIPNSKYTPSMEGNSVATLLSYCDDLTHLKPFESLLARLQDIHDSTPVAEWEQELATLAKKRWLRPLSPRAKW